MKTKIHLQRILPENYLDRLQHEDISTLCRRTDIPPELLTKNPKKVNCQNCQKALRTEKQNGKSKRVKKRV